MADAKIKVIIKRPDEQYGHVTNISPSLKNLQKTVEGSIEQVSIGGSTVLLCNEEGKIRNLERNFIIGFNGFVTDIICGTAIIAGVDGEGLVDVQISFDVWKRLLKEWGN